VRFWGEDEHERFLVAMHLYGRKDMRSISNYVGTRTPVQVRSHAQKYFLRLEREIESRMRLYPELKHAAETGMCSHSSLIGYHHILSYM
jgi:SHAQKYF class myb-like DNA-binding protein